MRLLSNHKPLAKVLWFSICTAFFYSCFFPDRRQIGTLWLLLKIQQLVSFLIVGDNLAWVARYKGVSPRLENVLKILDNCRKFLFCTSTRFSTNNFKLFAYTMPCGRVAQPLLRVFTRNLSLKRTRLLVPRWTLGERNVLHHITGFSQSFSSQPSKNAETFVYFTLASTKHT